MRYISSALVSVVISFLSCFVYIMSKSKLQKVFMQNDELKKMLDVSGYESKDFEKMI